MSELRGDGDAGDPAERGGTEIGIAKGNVGELFIRVMHRRIGKDGGAVERVIRGEVESTVRRVLEGIVGGVHVDSTMVVMGALQADRLLVEEPLSCGGSQWMRKYHRRHRFAERKCGPRHCR